MVRLTEDSIIDCEVGGSYQFIGTLKNASGMHCHDFYEVFLITKGSVVHYVNGMAQQLSEGSLIFIRPDDAHTYGENANEDCQFINIVFSQETFKDLLLYFDGGLEEQKLLNSIVPPFVALSEPETVMLKHRLDELNIRNWNDKKNLKIKLRALLVDVFVRFCINLQGNNQQVGIPNWLEKLCLEMQRKQNFYEGTMSMERISQKSREHICRSFVKHFHITPTEYVNQLRINYSANLLINSDLEIMDICLDSGFQSLSHFYHIFKRKFAVSPVCFRKQYKSPSTN